ncbi:uncharacterized protein [Spinacia oleracea]|uniref:F-box associated beta-propeller type 1 domain-containing protein n=1 Tax=Spinacia oleracea TaxID=3562 RepID=A0ABM3QS80_SPIOL|nr:uncharacterized protein LOC110788103 [Spinacia oleracea]
MAVGRQIAGRIMDGNPRKITGCWYTKDIDSVVHHDWGMSPDSVYHQGAVHLLVDDKILKSSGKVIRRTDMMFTRIVSFDCASETFTLGDLPKFKMESVYDCGLEQRFLCVFGESLALLDTSGKGNNIWVMEKQGGSKVIWTKRYQISCGVPDISPTFVDGAEDGMLLYEFLCRDLRCYNIEKNELKGFLNLSYGFCMSFMDSFVESLVLSRKLHVQTLTMFS